MAASVWLLNYDIAAADRDHYLSWFHDEHIPEKLALFILISWPTAANWHGRDIRC